jgi:hypothetical protein
MNWFLGFVMGLLLAKRGYNRIMDVHQEDFNSKGCPMNWLLGFTMGLLSCLVYHRQQEAAGKVHRGRRNHRGLQSKEVKTCCG